jgi:PPK2 family polyphosphate:nucleotide phosphotransferase
MLINSKDIAKTCRKLSEPYRIGNGSKFRLKDFDPDDTGDLKREDKSRAQDALATGVQALSELQEKLYALDQWSLLLIFQAMDAAGKDSAIKHVMSGINPQGCQVFSFKAPGSEELDHDYLWRCSRRLPERGRIGIFNRSYYEEVLVVRVHPELLSNQKLPEALNTKKIWKQRFEDIRNFEQYLTNNGTVIRKFFLNVSKKEQKKRFLDRLQEPDKHWKFAARDLHERDFWDDYQNAYEEMIQATATADAPWYVVPADNKWFTRIIVAAAIVETLDSLKLQYPQVTDELMKELETARALLLKNG